MQQQRQLSSLLAWPPDKEVDKAAPQKTYVGRSGQGDRTGMKRAGGQGGLLRRGESPG